jgi:ubiquinone/menaquinone biosynthesis C-methylase UbiE
MQENQMPEKILSRSAAQNFYDRIGSRYDWFQFYEAKAKESALNALDLSEGLNVLSVGVGTGKELVEIQAVIQPYGTAYGVDVSPVMAGVAKERVGTTICRADARQLPFKDQAFDRLYAGYVLDLLPFAHLQQLLIDFRRKLAPGGKLVILALTEGVDFPSRFLVWLWKTIFNISPAVCGGCRPLELSTLVEAAGFQDIERRVIVQAGVPSELINAEKG